MSFEAKFAAWGSPTRQGPLGTSMRHPPAAEDLEPSHWRPLLGCARLPLLFASTPVAELPCQGLFCRRTRAVRIFSRVLLNRILNDQYVHRAKVSHCILPTNTLLEPLRDVTSLTGEARANNHFFSGRFFNAALSCASLSSPHASGFPERIAS